MCAISQVQNPILQPANQVAKWGNLRTNFQIQANLRKYKSSFKFLFKPLIFSFFISHSHYKLRKSPTSCEAQKFQSIPSIGSPEVVGLKKTIPRTSAYPVEHEPLHFSHGQDERSLNRISISSQH